MVKLGVDSRQLLPTTNELPDRHRGDDGPKPVWRNWCNADISTVDRATFALRDEFAELLVRVINWCEPLS